MGQVRSQPKVAGYPNNRIIQDRIKEAPLYMIQVGVLNNNSWTIHGSLIKNKTRIDHMGAAPTEDPTASLSGLEEVQEYLPTYWRPVETTLSLATREDSFE